MTLQSKNDGKTKNSDSIIKIIESWTLLACAAQKSSKYTKKLALSALEPRTPYLAQLDLKFKYSHSPFKMAWPSRKNFD